MAALEKQLTNCVETGIVDGLIDATNTVVLDFFYDCDRGYLKQTFKRCSELVGPVHYMRKACHPVVTRQPQKGTTMETIVTMVLTIPVTFL